MNCLICDTKLEIRDAVIIDNKGKKKVRLKLEKQNKFYCWKCRRGWLTLK